MDSEHFALDEAQSWTGQSSIFGDGINFSLLGEKPKTDESPFDHFMFCTGVRIICLNRLQNCKGSVP